MTAESNRSLQIFPLFATIVLPIKVHCPRGPGSINLLGSKRPFTQVGQNGTWISDLLPYTSEIVDELTIIKSCKTDLFNHAPAKLFMNAGTGQFGRPSMGSWVTYGLGSECDDLPGFVVLQGGPRGPRGGGVLWGSGMLPTTYQGVPLRNQGDPILNLSTPANVATGNQRRVVDAVRELNLKRLAVTGDNEIATRIMPTKWPIGCKLVHLS